MNEVTATRSTRFYADKLKEAGRIGSGTTQLKRAF